MTSISGFQSDTQTLLEAHLDRLLPSAQSSRLCAAMRYSLFAGGKRLRPVLVRAAAETTGAEPELWLYPAAALEMIHTYSLIHDDLPAMDDDDLRRGQPTSHRQFDEATAILAGDALQSLAFEHLAQMPAELPAEVRLQMVQVLAEKAGQAGMVGGQMLDLQAEQKAVDQQALAHIHALKTGALIEAALRLGALCGQVAEPVPSALARYGRLLGLAFQITDDILDVTANTETLGKPQGSDQASNKSTYVRLLGLDGARQAARQQIDAARLTLMEAGLHSGPLHSLADYVLTRPN
ncbi:MAG: polyprenyl synthetase family protein [Saccharospirillum sp.]